MKKRFQKMLTGIFLLALLVLMPVFSAYAEEYAKNVESVNGRSAIVQKVSGTTGTAEVIRNNSSFTPAKGVRLAEGDSLKTSGDYRVYIMVDSTMVLRVDENSEVVIKKAALGQKLSVQVKSGKMFYNVAKQSADNGLEILINNVMIAIRGTSGLAGNNSGETKHMLFDGVVEVTDGKTSLTQVPSQTLTVLSGPGSELSNSAKVASFVLESIPKSVVEEMAGDKELMQRILTSVPLLAVNPEGVATYATDVQFLETIKGVDDAAVFPNTSHTSNASAVSSSGGSGGEGGSSTPDPEPAKVECPGCRQMIVEGASGHE